MAKRVTSINFFIVTGNILIPLYCVSLCIILLPNISGFLFCVFISASIIERAWETFKTSKEKKREEVHGDWTLVAVTAAYLLLFFIFISDFYFRIRHFDIYVTSAGIILIAISFRLRFWGMRALGKQWAVHAVGAKKIRKVRIIRLGPYKHIRHPIYLGIIIEMLGFSIFSNSLIAVLFSLIVCIPLVVIRAYVEERASVRRLGTAYEKYLQEVSMFLPLKAIKRVVR